MAKEDDDRTLPKFEDWLAPWERDKDGKKLDEPTEIDADRLKKHLYNLLTDKTRLQATVTEREAELVKEREAVTALRKEKETDDERRVREDKEREQRYASLEAKERERDKVDAITSHFEDKGITPAQARKLAKRVGGDDERSWLADADELVEDGFKVGTAKASESTEEVVDDITSTPRVVRADGKLAVDTSKSRPKSVRDELEAAGVFRDQW